MCLCNAQAALRGRAAGRGVISAARRGSRHAAIARSLCTIRCAAHKHAVFDERQCVALEHGALRIKERQPALRTPVDLQRQRAGEELLPHFAAEQRRTALQLLHVEQALELSAQEAARKQHGELFLRHRHLVAVGTQGTARGLQPVDGRIAAARPADAGVKYVRRCLVLHDQIQERTALPVVEPAAEVIFQPHPLGKRHDLIGKHKAGTFLTQMCQ